MRSQLEQEWKELKARKRIVEECPYFFYEPWGGQIDFEKSPCKIRLLIGSIRSGKTSEGVAEDVAHAMGFRHDGSKLNLPAPPTKGLIVVRDFIKITEVILPKIEALVAKSWITHVKNGSTGAPEILTFVNGSTVRIISQHQKPETADSADWHWAHIDEPLDQAFWARIIRGLGDHNGRAWMTMTPISCPWIYQDLYKRADGIHISVHHILFRDNPYLTAEAKEALLREIPAHERESFVEGKFSHLQGAIFPEFSRSRHVVRAHNPPDDCPIFMVMDPHDRRPSYIAWAYVDRRDRLVFFDEWPKTEFWTMKSVQLSIRDYSKIIRDVEGNWSNRVVERIIDPNFGRTPSHLTGRTLVEEYEEYGLSFYGEISNEITAGHHRIHDRLGSENREPGILFCDNCSNMIWAFENYIWKTKDMEEGFTGRERPDDIGKDQIDAVRYLLDFHPSYDMGVGGGRFGSIDPKEYGSGYG